MAKTVTVKESLKDTLVRTNSKVRSDRAEMIAEASKMSYDALVAKHKNDYNKLKLELASLCDMSTDNRTTTINALMELDTEAFVAKRFQILYQMRILEAKIEVLNEDKSFYVF